MTVTLAEFNEKVARDVEALHDAMHAAGHPVTMEYLADCPECGQSLDVEEITEREGVCPECDNQNEPWDNIRSAAEAEAH